MVAYLFWEQKVVCSNHTIPSYRAPHFIMFSLNLYLIFFLRVLEFYSVTCIFVTLMVIFATNAVYAILFLIGTFLLIGFIFILIGAEYLGLLFMLIYIGAIAILFLFILMLLDLRNLMKQRIQGIQMFFFTSFLLLFVEYLLYFFNFGPLEFLVSPKLMLFHENTVTGASDLLLLISPALYNIYFYYIIGCGFILLFVMVGVVLLLAEWTFPFNPPTLVSQTSQNLINYQRIRHVKYLN